jgi:hypothetical protein
MVGRTRLYQKTGSPLIQGSSRRRAMPPWLGFVLLAVVAAAGLWFYLNFVR